MRRLPQVLPQEKPLSRRGGNARIRLPWARLGRSCGGVLLVAISLTRPGYAETTAGEYVLRAAGCPACHTDIENGGKFLAGGRPIRTPFGTFYSPNITPDRDTGIGGWTRRQFHEALTQGVGPGGDHYYPVFPYTAYSGMKPEDVDAVYDYLQQVPPVKQASRPHDLSWYVGFRFVNRLWQWAFFTPHEPPADRGEYLVRSLGHCDECHTPRDAFGALDYDRHLAGTDEGPEGEPVPNITPDRETGIGRWSMGELTRYLRIGMLPDRDFAGGLMVDVIDESLSYLTDADREAIASYLKSLPPISNAVGD